MYYSSANAILIVVVSLLLYLLPSIIGWRKQNASTIVAVNIILGWTIVGWLIALYWATHDPKPRLALDEYPLPPPEGLLCSSCGSYSGPGSKYCSHCGALLATPFKQKSA